MSNLPHCDEVRQASLLDLGLDEHLVAGHDRDGARHDDRHRSWRRLFKLLSAFELQADGRGSPAQDPLAQRFELRSRRWVCLGGPGLVWSKRRPATKTIIVLSLISV
jgi:hypothetical protein